MSNKPHWLLRWLKATIIYTGISLVLFYLFYAALIYL
jgi:hypothetical protein